MIHRFFGDVLGQVQGVPKLSVLTVIQIHSSIHPERNIQAVSNTIKRPAFQSSEIIQNGIIDYKS
jgi:hypothetical protein